MTALRVVRIPVGGKDTPAICCPGTDATGCGTLLTRPGKCPWRDCGRVLTQAEYDAAIREAAEPKEEAA